MTLEQSIVSSGSVTFTLKGMGCPMGSRVPLPGVSMTTLGSVLPTTMRTLALPVLPSGSLAVKVAV